MKTYQKQVAVLLVLVMLWMSLSACNKMLPQEKTFLTSLALAVDQEMQKDSRYETGITESRELTDAAKEMAEVLDNLNSEIQITSGQEGEALEIAKKNNIDRSKNILQRRREFTKNLKNQHCSAKFLVLEEISPESIAEELLDDDEKIECIGWSETENLACGRDGSYYGEAEKMLIIVVQYGSVRPETGG